MAKGAALLASTSIVQLGPSSRKVSDLVQSQAEPLAQIWAFQVSQVFDSNGFHTRESQLRPDLSNKQWVSLSCEPLFLVEIFYW